MNCLRCLLFAFLLIGSLIGWQSCVPSQAQKPQSLEATRAQHIDQYQQHFCNRRLDSAFLHLNQAYQLSLDAQDWVSAGAYSRRLLMLGRLLARDRQLTVPQVDSLKEQLCANLRPHFAENPLLLAYHNLIILHDLGLTVEKAEQLCKEIERVAIPIKAQGLLLQTYGLMMTIVSANGNRPTVIYNGVNYYDKLEQIWANYRPSDGDYLISAFPAFERWEANFKVVAHAKKVAQIETAELWTDSTIEDIKRYKYLHKNYLANAYSIYSEVHLEKNDFEKALACLEEQEQLLQDSNPKIQVLQATRLCPVYELQASIAAKLGKYQQAARKLELVRQLLNKAYAVQVNGAEKKYNFVPYYSQMAKNLLALGQPDRAGLYLDSLLAQGELYKREYFQIKAKQALKVGDYPQAVKLAEQAFAALKDNRQQQLSALGEVAEGKQLMARCYLANQQLDKALGLIAENLSFYGQSAHALGWWENPNFDSIANKYTAFATVSLKLEALAALLKNNQLPIGRDSFLRHYYQTAQLSHQLLQYNLLRLSSEQTQTQLLQQVYDNYEHGFEAAYQLYQIEQDSGYFNQIWSWSEQTKSLFLLQTLYGEERHKFAGVPDSLVEKQQDLQRNRLFYEQQLLQTPKSDTPRIVKLQTLLSDNLQQRQQLDDYIQTNHPKYYELENQPAFVQVKELQNLLGDSTLLLSYWVGKSYVYILTVSKSHYFVKRQPSDSAQALLNQLLPLYADPRSDRNQLHRLSFEVYQQYVEPNLLPSCKELILIPDGLFNYLPFEALLTQAAADDEARNWAYLLQQYHINYQYSGSLYQQLQTKESQASNWQILGLSALYESPKQANINPEQQRTRALLAPLPGADQEILKLSELYRGDFYIGETNTESNFKLNAGYYGILHFAMHNVVDKYQPERSALVFSENPDSSDDGFLHSYEIKSLDLNADLVVLSACETGYGKYQRGEGVVSVGRSFVYAGARSLLTSLWTLNDYSAPVITLRFYEYLQQGYSKSEALQRSKLDYLQTANSNSAHPALWACLVQSGNTLPISPSKRVKIWWYFIPLGAIVGIGWWARNALRQRRKF